ncbi:PhzF family phenazine biosynthesis protein [Proteinivorax tanatarense]|uniref:PhzF family phenazine biosynthesis protein n=1 Tax=Proteinivorax tanatarense TaxID=1260629 RepID=A0AAU7VHI5_9FIRM
MIKIHKVSAFAVQKNGGNPAGVVFDADNLTEQQMKKIAAEVGYSETAFVSQSQLADFKVRFFTPTSEVDLCGHATIAVFNLLRDLKKINTNEIYTQQTKAGILQIKIKEKEVLMEQTKPKYLDIIRPSDMRGCFHNLDYLENMPIQIMSTGLADLILPVKSLKTLYNLKPNFDKIKELSKKLNIVGIHAFTLESLHNSNAHARNFAPLYGINEEAATGTSNGALACYLQKYYSPSLKSYVMEQGYTMDRPSEIKVKLKTGNNNHFKVYVGGGIKRI